jgi:hypothetical protein
LFFDFWYLIYTLINKKNKNMKRKVKVKKINASITLEPKVLEIVNSNFSNRSKFIENIIIEELCKNENNKEELKKIKIIL